MFSLLNTCLATNLIFYEFLSPFEIESRENLAGTKEYKSALLFCIKLSAAEKSTRMPQNLFVHLCTVFFTFFCTGKFKFCLVDH